jgi:hypothetical protein
VFETIRARRTPGRERGQDGRVSQSIIPNRSIGTAIEALLFTLVKKKTESEIIVKINDIWMNEAPRRRHPLHPAAFAHCPC